MIIFSVVLWVISALFILSMIIVTSNRVRKYKKEGKTDSVLKQLEVKLWISALFILPLLTRLVLLYLDVFQKDPSISVSISFLKEYFRGIVLSFLWIPQLPLIFSSVALLISIYARNNLSKKIIFLVKDNLKLLLSALLYLVLVLSLFLVLFKLQIISTWIMCSLILYAKIIIVTLALINLKCTSSQRESI